jgi:hypothetical protein
MLILSGGIFVNRYESEGIQKYGGIRYLIGEEKSKKTWRYRFFYLDKETNKLCFGNINSELLYLISYPYEYVHERYNYQIESDKSILLDDDLNSNLIFFNDDVYQSKVALMKYIEKKSEERKSVWFHFLPYLLCPIGQLTSEKHLY